MIDDDETFSNLMKISLTIWFCRAIEKKKKSEAKISHWLGIGGFYFARTQIDYYDRDMYVIVQ